MAPLSIILVCLLLQLCTAAIPDATNATPVIPPTSGCTIMNSVSGSTYTDPTWACPQSAIYTGTLTTSTSPRSVTPNQGTVSTPETSFNADSISATAPLATNPAVQNPALSAVFPTATTPPITTTIDTFSFPSSTITSASWLFAITAINAPSTASSTGDSPEKGSESAPDVPVATLPASGVSAIENGAQRSNGVQISSLRGWMKISAPGLVIGFGVLTIILVGVGKWC